MHYQVLKNFITERIRKNDIFIPTAILFLVKNEGKGTKKEISRLAYIFDYKFELEHYDKIIDKLVSTILEDYNIIKKDGEHYTLTTWPLKEKEIENIITLCAEVSNGFFSLSNNNKRQIIKERTT